MYMRRDRLPFSSALSCTVKYIYQIRVTISDGTIRQILNQQALPENSGESNYSEDCQHPGTDRRSSRYNWCLGYRNQYPWRKWQLWKWNSITLYPAEVLPQAHPPTDPSTESPRISQVRDGYLDYCVCTYKATTLKSHVISKQSKLHWK